MSQYKQKCCELHTHLISFTCYLAQIKRGVVKNRPIAKVVWDHLASVQRRFTPLSVVFSPQLPCWPPTPLPRPSTALASSCWCEICWIIDDLVCWLNWKMGGLGQSKMEYFFLFFSSPTPQPKIWKRNPQISSFKSELNILFWILVKALSCVLLGQNTQRRNRGRTTRDRK